MPLKLLLCGTGPFAVPSFLALLRSPHTALAVVTRPIADPGQRRRQAANPVREMAETEGLAIHEPPDINGADFIARIRSLQPDLLVVCDYGQILSDECLAAARLGAVNLHGSLLPKYRGAAPVAWAIWRGESVTGVSVIHMTGKLDGGPVLESAELEIGPQETCDQLETRLARLGVEPLLRAVGMLEKWDGRSPIGEIQDPRLVSSARRLRKEDARIGWERPARKIHNQVRALQPWPGTYSLWRRSAAAEPIRLIVTRTEVVPAAEVLTAEAGTAVPAPPAGPGTVAVADGKRLILQTGNGFLAILGIQPAGKKPMPIADFLRGYPVKPGDRME